MSPSTRAVTSPSSMPARGRDVGQAAGQAAAERLEQVLGRGGRVVLADQHGRVVGVDGEGLARGACSPPAPWKPSMVVRLWVPPTHRVVVRNWKRASSGCSRTAPMVAKSASVSTPLSWWVGCGGHGGSSSRGGVRHAVSAARSPAGAGREASSCASRSRASLSSIWSSTKRVGSGKRASVAGQPEDVSASAASRAALRTPRAPRASPAAPARAACERVGEQLGVAEGVGDAVAGDRVAVVAGVADQRPAGAVRARARSWAGRRTPRTGDDDPAGADPLARARARSSAMRVDAGRSARRAPAVRTRSSRARGPAQPHAGLAVVGRERPRRRRRGADVELEAAPGDLVDVGVEGRDVRAEATAAHPGAEPGRPSTSAARRRRRRSGHAAVSRGRRASRAVDARRPGRRSSRSSPVTAVPVRSVGAGRDRRLGEQRSRVYAAGRPAGRRRRGPSRGRVRSLAAAPKRHLADGRGSGGEHLVEQAPAGQLDDSAAGDARAWTGCRWAGLPARAATTSYPRAASSRAVLDPAHAGADDDHVVMGGVRSHVPSIRPADGADLETTWRARGEADEFGRPGQSVPVSTRRTEETP